MNKKTKAAILTGTLALSGLAGQTQLVTQNNDTASEQAVAPATSLEESFLTVKNVCKWRHASFDAVQIGHEQVANAVLAIHAELERA